MWEEMCCFFGKNSVTQAGTQYPHNRTFCLRTFTYAPTCFTRPRGSPHQPPPRAPPTNHRPPHTRPPTCSNTPHKQQHRRNMWRAVQPMRHPLRHARACTPQAACCGSSSPGSAGSTGTPCVHTAHCCTYSRTSTLRPSTGLKVNIERKKIVPSAGHGLVRIYPSSPHWQSPVKWSKQRGRGRNGGGPLGQTPRTPRQRTRVQQGPAQLHWTAPIRQPSGSQLQCTPPPWPPLSNDR